MTVEGFCVCPWLHGPAPVEGPVQGVSTGHLAVGLATCHLAPWGSSTRAHPSHRLTQANTEVRAFTQAMAETNF